MPLKISNNAVSRLAANAAYTANTITLTPGEGAKFPAIVTGEYFPLTIIRASDSAIEIVKATARSTDVITITRGQEGTAALSFLAGDRVELRMTAATFSDEISRVETKADAAQSTADAIQATAEAAQSAANAAQSTANGALQRSGGVMTGPTTLSGNATENLHAVPKQQLESVVAAAVASKADSSAVNAALALKANSMDVAASLAAKADLVGGKVPLYQLPSIETGLTIGTPVNTNTSGTSYTITGIPSGAKQVVIVGAGITTAINRFLVRIGSGSMETSGYIGLTVDGGQSGLEWSNGITLPSGAAGGTINFSITLTLLEESSNTWEITAVSNAIKSASYSPSFVSSVGTGSVTLTGSLDRVGLVVLSSSFTGGKFNVAYM